MNNFDQYLAERDAAIAAVNAPTPTQLKQDRLLQRASDKQSKLNPEQTRLNNLAQIGFNDPVTRVLSSSNIHAIDGDTYRVNGEQTSTRTLGVDTYETTKDAEWLSQPNNQARMAKQRGLLSAELGREVTNDDVFSSGNAQKSAAKAFTQQELPQLLTETLLVNDGTQTFTDRNGKAHVKNYGRNLGALKAIGGSYSVLDANDNLTGEVGNGAYEVLNSNEANALTQARKYKANKYSTDAKETEFTPGSITGYNDSTSNDRATNLIDAAKYGLGRTAAGIADSLVDASTRGYMEVYKGITGSTEEEAQQHIINNSSLFERDAKGNFIGLDDYKEAKAYGYDNSRTTEATKELGDAFDSGNYGNMAAAVLSGIAKAGPEWFLESAGELATSINPIGLTLNAGKYSNDIMEERSKNLKEGEELSLGGRALAIATGTATALLNKLGADEILGNTKVVKSIVDAVSKPGGKAASKNILSIVANKAISGTAVVAGKGTYEGLEEIAQEMVQKFGEKYGTEAQDTLLSSETGKELFQAFGGGFAGGVTPSATTSIAKGTFDIANDTIVDKISERGGKISEKVSAVIDKHRPSTELQKANPDIPAASLKTATKQVQEAPATNSEDTYDNAGNPVAPEVVDPAAYGAATAEWAANQPKVVAADTISTDISGNSSTEYSKLPEKSRNIIDEASADFDEQAAGIMPYAAHTSARIKAGTISKDLFEGEDNIASDFSAAISELVEVRDEIADLGGTAVPEKLAAMDDVISRMTPLASSTSTADLDAMVADLKVQAPAKVRSILGSSQASIEHINKVLADPTITPTHRKLLEFKASVIQSDVGRTKMDQGGTRPGAMQWASMIAGSPGNQSFIDRLNSFVDGQRSKTSPVVSIVAAWDKAHKMPWTKGNELKQGSTVDGVYTGEESEFGVRHPNGKDINDHEVRQAMRAQATNSTGKAAPTKLNAPLTIAGKSYDTAIQIAQIAHNLSKEQAQLDELQGIIGTTPAVQEGTKKASKETEKVITQEEVKEAPVGDNGLTVSDLVSLTKDDYLAMHADEYSAIGNRIGDLGKSSPLDSKERKDLREAYKFYTKVGTAIKSGKFSDSPLYKSINERNPVSTGVSTPKESTEAPVEAEETKLPTAKEVANKIATGKPLTKEDEQTQANDKVGVEEELSILKTALNDTTIDDINEAFNTANEEDAATTETLPATPEKPVKAQKEDTKVDSPVEDTKGSDAQPEQVVHTNKVTIGDTVISFTSIPEDSSKPLAASTSDGIYLQKGLTVAKVIDYLQNTEAATPAIKSIVKVKQEVNTEFNTKYGKDFLSILSGMSTPEVRKFILLHEHRHLLQEGKRESRKDFIEDYLKDPVKFELDANEYSLKMLGVLPSVVEKPSNITEKEQSNKESATIPEPVISETPIKDDIKSKRKIRLEIARAKQERANAIMDSIKPTIKKVIGCGK